MLLHSNYIAFDVFCQCYPVQDFTCNTVFYKQMIFAVGLFCKTKMFESKWVLVKGSQQGHERYGEAAVYTAWIFVFIEAFQSS